TALGEHVGQRDLLAAGEIDHERLHRRARVRRAGHGAGDDVGGGQHSAFVQRLVAVATGDRGALLAVDRVRGEVERGVRGGGGIGRDAVDGQPGDVVVAGRGAVGDRRAGRFRGEHGLARHSRGRRCRDRGGRGHGDGGARRAGATREGGRGDRG